MSTITGTSPPTPMLLPTTAPSIPKGGNNNDNNDVGFEAKYSQNPFEGDVTMDDDFYVISEKTFTLD